MSEALSNYLKDYDYELPDELIAQRPIEGEPSQARLLVVRKNPETGMPRFEDLLVADLPELIKSTRSLSNLKWVRNRTRVLPCRFYALRAHAEGHSRHEIVLLKEEKKGMWQALIRGQKRFHYPQRLELENKTEGSISVPSAGFVDLSGLSRPLYDFLSQYGEMPLPPYIRERVPEEDKQRYQNPFAESGASAAAPTASLHFSPRLQAQLEGLVHFEDIVLNVGLGTFAPVRCERLSEHHMHEEDYELSIETFLRLRQQHEASLEGRTNGKAFAAIGTTVLRCLESIDWSRSVDSNTQVIREKTSLFVRDPSQIRCCQALWTNFHLPQSTLLVLLSAFAGSSKLVLEAYAHAVKQKYRFFSYGDASLWID